MNILEPACLLRPFTMQARPVTVSLAVVLLTSCVTSATLRSDEDRALYDRCDRMAKFDAKAYAPSNGSGGGGHVGNVPPFPPLIAAALVVSVLVAPAVVVYVSVKRQRIYDDAYERCMQVSPAGAAGFAMGFPEGFPRHDVEGVIGKPIAVQNVDNDSVMAVYEYVGRHDKSHMYRMEIVYGPGDTIIESYPERDSRRPIQGGWEGCADKADRELRRVRRAGDLTIPPALLLRADQAIE